ncbi:MAG TPA: HD domain-containing protein [Patescibacteria group bacterium]|nr:HD domain-containing protein [Patescibacteria group bacterium]
MDQKLTEKFEQALQYAVRLHAGQFRKGSGVPYASHLLAVTAIVMENDGDEDTCIAALLHDAAEDQGGRETLEEIRVLFGETVADIVTDCTDSWIHPKPPWRGRKEDYVAKLADKPEDSLLVSLADKIHNARSILADCRSHGDDLWQRFQAGKDGVLWYYGALVQAFRKSGAYPGLVDELDRIVTALNAVAHASDRQ